MSAKSRHVDKIPFVSPRPKEMQLICVGLSRNGTKSLQTALQRLGYTPYHGSELFKPENLQEHHLECWEEGLATRRRTGETYGRAEFDRLLGRYDSVSDSPVANFGIELSKAYPEAKVILTSRNTAAWIQSMENLYYWLDIIITWHPMTLFSQDFWVPFRQLMRTVLADLTDGDIYNRKALARGYEAHNKRMRDDIAPDRFLDFDLRQGWEPLCNFLGKDVPDEPFPRINEGTQGARGVFIIMTIQLVGVLAKPAGVALVGVAAWYFLLANKS